ncbi:MAG: hypothetical protein ABI840_10850 [bacterium]
MKTLLIVIIFSSLFPGPSGKDPILMPSELKIFTGKIWKGNLTYKDYSKDTEVTIPSELLVVQSDTNPADCYFSMMYPDEPQMNSTTLIKLSDEGKKFDGEIIIEKKYLKDGSLYFVTESKGADNDKKADIRHLYTINASEFIIKKEVRYEGQEDFFLRNKYEFQR